MMHDAVGGWLAGFELQIKVSLTENFFLFNTQQDWYKALKYMLIKQLNKVAINPQSILATSHTIMLDWASFH